MAYTVHEITLGKTNNLATLTLIEDAGKQNRVVYVIVPLTQRVKLTTAQKKTEAKKQAKAALQEAATAL